MADRLPPLTAIRYFEAAARHLSFSKAAEELHVTHSAISHQIKALEEWLGVPLFRRFNRRIALTDAGQTYMKPVREAFEWLGEASRVLKAREQGGTLTVSTMPSFAARWLVPRLGSFRRAHPSIDLRISASEKLVDFARDDVDVGIRYGRGIYPGLRTDLLMRESYFPVCSPALLAGELPLNEPGDLLNHTLLYDFDWRDNLWILWLNAAGIKINNLHHTLSFNHTNLMLQAAVDGLGVAMSHHALASDDLRNGRLVRPFAFGMPAEFAYYLVAPEPTADRPKIVAFRNWVIDEIKTAKEARNA